MVQWLGLHASTWGGTGSIPGWETKIPKALWCSQKITVVQKIELFPPKQGFMVLLNSLNMMGDICTCDLMGIRSIIFVSPQNICGLPVAKICTSLLSSCSLGGASELPWGLSDKESACQCRRRGFSAWIRKIPWRRAWQPAPVFLPGESHGQRSLAGHGPWGWKRVGTT